MSIARAFDKRGVSSVFVCKTRYIHEQYLKAGFESYFVSQDLYQAQRISEEEIHHLDTNYGPPGIGAIGDSDVQVVALFKGREVEKKQYIAHTYKFWESFFVEHDITTCVARETATFLTRTAYNVSRHNNIPFGQLAIGPSEKHFSVDNINESHVWSALLSKIKKGLRSLNRNEEQEVYDFISEYIGEGKKGPKLRFVPPSFLKSFRQYIGMWLYDNSYIISQDPIRAAALKYGRRRFEKKLMWKYVTRLFFPYDEPKDGEHFVYFPFYSGEETSYLVNDHYWARNGVSLIRELAANLPSGYKLYVKEHPTNPGDFTLSQLRELKKSKTIRVLRPTVSGRDLIRKSKAVIVLQGTTGWEAFLLKVPVITLSKPFFFYSSIVYKSNDISDIAPVLWEAINRGDSIYKDNENEWMWFIHCVITTSGVGMTVDLEPPYGFVGDEENGEKIAQYLLENLLI